MRVAFYRDDESRVTGWHAVRGKRTRIPGTVMALEFSALGPAEVLVYEWPSTDSSVRRADSPE